MKINLDSCIHGCLHRQQISLLQAILARLGRSWHLVEPLVFFVLVLVNCWTFFRGYLPLPLETSTFPRHRADGRTLPHVLIIGASKCGTIPFAGFLRINPKISFSGHWPRYFNHDDTYKNKGVEWYSREFAALNSSADQIILDGNAAYFSDPRVPARVAATDPTMKIIVILREPVSRMISDYAQAIVAKRKAANLPDLPFRDIFIDKKTQAVNINTLGLIWSVYEVHLRRWLQYFPLSQIHVIDGEQFLQDPMQVIHKTDTFLGIPHHITKNDLAFNRATGYYCARRPTYVQCFGHGKNWNRPDVDKDTHERLTEFFKPYNEKLFKLINKRFDW